MLRYMDYRIAGVATLAVCLVLAGIRMATGRGKPTASEFLNVALALGSIYGGIVVATIFLLTKPPAIEFLSSGDFVFTAIVTLVGTISYGTKEIMTSFFPPKPPDTEPKNDLIIRP
jgi:hypothetical protein